jgi:hypothetical protein
MHGTDRKLDTNDGCGDFVDLDTTRSVEIARLEPPIQEPEACR